MKPKLITIDGDGCLFSYKNIGSEYESSWDALGFAYKLKEKFDALIKKYYSRREEGVDKKWAEEEAEMLKGMRVADCFRILYPVPYCPGAKEFADATKGKIFRGVLSTGIDLVVEKAREELGLDFAYCNVLNRHKGNGTFDGTISYNVPLWRKEEKLAEICKRNDIVFMAVFGSFVRGEQDKKSDIDIAIEFDKNKEKSLFDLVHVENELKKLFKRKVDLGIFSSLNPYVIEDVRKEMRVVYQKR